MKISRFTVRVLFVCDATCKSRGMRVLGLRTFHTDGLQLCTRTGCHGNGVSLASLLRELTTLEIFEMITLLKYPLSYMVYVYSVLYMYSIL